MKAKFIIKTFLVSLFMIGTLMSCTGYNEELIDALEVNRVFSPIDLKATVRNQTNVELNWTVRDDADHYVVEFSADDETFSTIFKTVNVTPAQLPITVALEGLTKYSIRVKAVSATGLEDSKWSTVTATTLSEQIFKSIVNGDIVGTQATLRWTAGSNVTQIVLLPGNITHTITADEKTAGVATITGLAGETSYTATLYNGTKIRGVLSFVSGVDVTSKIVVSPTDNLLQKIADAPSGATLVLQPGDYTSQSGTITLAKSIKIQGFLSYDKPKLNVTFSLASGTSNLSLKDLDLNGTGITNASVVSIASNNAIYGDILISSCNVHDYTRSIIGGSTITGSKVNSFTVDNSIVTNVNTNIGADFIDFRNIFVANVTLQKSTFNGCSASRDFVRIDAATGFSGTGLTSTVLIDACTIYGNTMLATNRILYVRFLNNVLAVRNTLFASTAAMYSNQANTATATFLNNNYFNSPTLNLASPVSPVKSDATGTSLDPGFTNAATGDFTISNQTLKDRLVGDPRWIK